MSKNNNFQNGHPFFFVLYWEQWDPYVAKNLQQVEMIQRRAAHWVLGCYDRLDSVTDNYVIFS